MGPGVNVDRDEEFRWFFAAEYPTVVRTAYFILRDHGRAEEITQEAFVRLLTHWAKVSKYESPQAWVRRVAIRLAVRDANRERRRALLTRKQAAAEREPALDTVATAAMDLDLLAAIRLLPPKQRAAVVLFYLEDRPMAEVAEILECSTATGWVHLHRARKALATMLSEEVTEDVR